MPTISRASNRSSFTCFATNGRTSRFNFDSKQRRPIICVRAIASGSLGRSVHSEIYVVACCDAATSGAGLGALETLNEATSVPTGDQQTLVMVANFRDASVSCSLDQINNAVFADPAGLSVDALYRDNSRGQVSFSGAVVGPFALDTLSTDACDLAGWSNAADARAAASGVDVASYPRKVYVAPQSNTCPGVGFGSVGGNPSTSLISICGRLVFAYVSARVDG